MLVVVVMLEKIPRYWGIRSIDRCFYYLTSVSSVGLGPAETSLDADTDDEIFHVVNGVHRRFSGFARRPFGAMWVT